MLTTASIMSCSKARAARRPRKRETTDPWFCKLCVKLVDKTSGYSPAGTQQDGATNERDISILGLEEVEVVEVDSSHHQYIDTPHDLPLLLIS